MISRKIISKDAIWKKKINKMHADSTCDLTKNSISLYLFHLQSSFYDFLTKNSWNQPSLAVNWLHEIFSYYVIAQCGNSGNSLSHFFDKNFVKPTVLLNKLLKSWFHEIFFQWERISEISTLWNSKFKNISWIQFISRNYFCEKSQTRQFNFIFNSSLFRPYWAEHYRRHA